MISTPIIADTIENQTKKFLLIKKLLKNQEKKKKKLSQAKLTNVGSNCKKNKLSCGESNPDHARDKRVF